jgi:two-component system, OmpR family, sensor histidine kinase TctE
MTKNIPSISSRLITWLTIPLLILTTAVFVYFYIFSIKKVTKFFDNRLLASAKSIEHSLGIEDGELFVDIPSFSIELLSTNDKGLIYYSVIDDKKNLLIGYNLSLNKKLIDEDIPEFYYTTFNGSKLRTVSYKATLYSSGKVYNAYITIGETTEERNEYIQQILILLLVIMSIVIFCSITITLFAVRQGLKPLRELKEIIKKRDEKDLVSLVFDAPKELEDVVKSINILLERSRNTIEYIEQFNSDISHQLRTPLAEMKMQLETIYNKKDKNYIALNSVLNNMKHITEQLLLYAKTNPNTINLKRFKKESLNQVCKNYSLKVAPRIYKKGFEFAFEDMNEEFFINCDSIMIESMLDNIINNALHYALDDNGNPIGTITLSLKKHNNTIWLSVKDEGKGVDKEYLNNIFKRYYRVDSGKQGTGLGLSIVKQIASLHNAKVNALNENGLKISIIFRNKN